MFRPDHNIYQKASGKIFTSEEELRAASLKVQCEPHETPLETLTEALTSCKLAKNAYNLPSKSFHFS